LRLDGNWAKRKQQPIGCSVEAVATMIGCLPTQAIAFGWKPGLRLCHIKFSQMVHQLSE